MAVKNDHVSDEFLIVSDSQSSIHSCLGLTVKNMAKYRGRVLRQLVLASNGYSGINMGFIPGAFNPGDIPSRMKGGFCQGTVKDVCNPEIDSMVSRVQYVLKNVNCIAYSVEAMQGHVQRWVACD